MRGGSLFRQASLLAVLWLMNYQGVAKFTEAKTLVSMRQLLHVWNFKLLCMSETCLRGKGGRVTGEKCPGNVSTGLASGLLPSQSLEYKTC